MSNYAQIITSFERTGNFPLEANYVFATVDALKEFYSDEVQVATLHKGLLKVVESNADGKQALYWVTKKATNDELEFTELICGDNISDILSNITDIQDALAEEIEARTNADTALWGVNDPTNIDESYNSINDLANQVKDLQSALAALDDESVSGDDSLKNQVKAIAGTTDNDVISYLDTLSYESITAISNELDRIVKGTGDSTDAIDTLYELSNFLSDYTNEDTLKQLLDKMWFTIEGLVLPSENFRTLRGIEDYVIELETANNYFHDQVTTELNNIETGVGLNADGSYSADAETYYLQNATSVMNALKILDSLLHTYISANTPSVRNNDSAIYLELTQELDSYVFSAQLKLSTEAGNQLIKNTDGLYTHAQLNYENGVLQLITNGNITSEYNIGLSAVVNSAYYDASSEQLVMNFKLDNGEIQTIYVPFSELIREWEPLNSSTSPIVLTRTEVINGTDKLSADVNLSGNEHNILVKDGNTLLVEGLAGNIVTESGLTVQASLDEQQAEIDTKAPIDSPILKGVPEVETSPDDDDSSQRIPSTAWVWARLAEISAALTAKLEGYTDDAVANLKEYVEQNDNALSVKIDEAVETLNETIANNAEEQKAYADNIKEELTQLVEDTKTEILETVNTQLDSLKEYIDTSISNMKDELVELLTINWNDVDADSSDESSDDNSTDDEDESTEEGGNG